MSEQNKDLQLKKMFYKCTLWYFMYVILCTNITET